METKPVVAVIGCGYMGLEYSKVLKAQGITPIVIGRGAERAAAFEEKTGIAVLTGGVDEALKKLDVVPDYTIVAVGTDYLSDVSIKMIEYGIKNVLVEKPAGLSREEMVALDSSAIKHGASVFVAYNRRFYASVERAMEIIKGDGGVSSVFFEFTEWSNDIEKIDYPRVCKENFLLANSTHVIDLAFFLAGHPREISSYVRGGLPWHPNGSIYSGAGCTDRDVLFSYCANWEAPGRWSVEVMTRKHRLYFKPMEKLAIQELNSVKVSEVEIDDKLDVEFKPGLYNETFAFLNNQDDPRMISLSEQLDNLKSYEKIAGISNK